MNLFVDSAAHLALVCPDDQFHAPAKEFMRGLDESKLFTSRFVLGEVLTRGVRDVGAPVITEYVRRVLSLASYRVVPALEAIFDESMDALAKYEDQGLSFVDCTNVVIMRNSRIRTIFTFDRAFRRLGFEVVP